MNRECSSLIFSVISLRRTPLYGIITLAIGKRGTGKEIITTRIVARMLTFALVLALAFAACAETGGALAPQNLDYTENPVDIPNPDRGFYRANDGMVVPVTATPESLGL